MAKAIVTFTDHETGFYVTAEFDPQLDGNTTSNAQAAALSMLHDLQARHRAAGNNVEQRILKYPWYQRTWRWLFG